MVKRKIRLIIILLLVTLITACDLVEKEELHIAAASDLRFAFEELGELFEEEHDVKVVFQFGSSGNLAQQIANGAPIDLFASANKNFVEDLIEGGHIIERTKALYAIGRIVLVVNKESEIDIDSLEDLSLEEIEFISLANPSHAPYGLAAKEALESKGLWEALEDKIVYGENVSQAMQFVRTANAPVGIIALSIADVDELEYFLIDASYHNPLEQKLGVVSYSNNKDLAKDFGRFINSPSGRDIMDRYGFHLP